MYIGTEYLVLSTRYTKYIQSIGKYMQILSVVWFTQTDVNKIPLTNKTKKPAASLFSRRQGLVIPIHMKMSSISIDIQDYTLWVLRRVLYINYIALAIDPFLG